MGQNPRDPHPRPTAVQVPVDHQRLNGDLSVPPGAQGLVLFAHGSGSSRHSPRNQFVARVLEGHGLATLLIDLLTPEEERWTSGPLTFGSTSACSPTVSVAIIGWLHRQPQTSQLRIGLFGASTGGGAALVAAALRPDDVSAIVSRGGRPDLAGPALAQVTAPTLLIVGGGDTAVIGMNQDAMAQMHAEVKLEIVPGATHLFEEPGTLERVADLAADFFRRRLQSGSAISEPLQK